MSQLIVGKRYARALFEVAKERGTIRETEEDLIAAVETIRQNEKLRAVLMHRDFSKAAKLNLLKELFSGKVSDIVLNTLLVAVDKGREAILTMLPDEYIRLANEALNRTQAVVYSPFPLSDEEQKAVAEKFGELTGKTVSITNVVQPELLGGIKVRIGDHVYDGSLARKLKELEKTLTQNAM